MKSIWHYSLYISALYALAIVGLQKWMENRKPYNLRRPLFVWSLGLSLFSFIGFYCCGFTHLRLLVSEGFESSICSKLMHNGRAGLWMFLFVISKAPELVDTYFIILRKQKLIFLHWYHHITVFIYCWYHYTKQIYMAQWFCTMNYGVHAVMYLYYAVRAPGYYRPPVWVNKFITMLQLGQMVLGVTVNSFVYYKMTDPSWYCDGTIEKSFFYVYCSLAMYLSYFVLFAHFFYTTYVVRHSSSASPPPPPPTTTTTTTTKRHFINGPVLANGGPAHLWNTSYKVNTNGHVE